MASITRQELCLRLIRKASRSALNAFNHYPLHIQQKTDNSYVTETDLAIESKMLKQIKLYFPKDHIISEEAGSIGSKSQYEWYLDPLDGTSNFIFHFPLFGSMITITKDKIPNIAAIALPLSDMITFASISNYTTINNQQIVSTSSTELKKTTLFIESGKTEAARQKAEKYLKNSTYR